MVDDPAAKAAAAAKVKAAADAKKKRPKEKAHKRATTLFAKEMEKTEKAKRTRR